MMSAVGFAEVKPASLFSDHAVLQSGMSVPVWGTADPGEKVTVTLHGVSASTTTGADGRWMVRLKKLKAGGPFEMTIAGKNTVTVKDVLVGEVWLGSGQSNMVFTVSKKSNPWAGMLDEEGEIAAANYPQIRMFTGKATKAYEPQTDIVGEWKVCSPETAGDFSAVGYLFARDLQRELKVPVGIVLEAYGASTAESWLPRPTVAGDPMLKPLLDKFDARVSYYREHPGGLDADAPAGPQTLNARPAKAGAKPAKMRDPVQDQHQPTVLFNGMIQPVLPYAIRGVLWYQGESIVGGKAGVELYPHTMETLVKEWRQLWGEGELPFYYVQLAALQNASNNPAVREAQAQLLKLPKTAMAVTIDIGDPKLVHPKNKEPLGERLTAIALAKTYGRKMEYSGPVYESMKVKGNAIELKFAHDKGLTAKNGPLKWFQIAGADQKFVDAEAKIEGNKIIVTSAQVSAPVAVRYAWADYPEGCNLYNGAGFPAAPFRTDKWDALTPIAAEFTGK
ncbi:sialate O-acetylesterase [Edaphobacter dinghuensis]|uniref:9-O-acetylesterase n=1 Tax=Edaphobacter dinghuensis TaxID=1560005 RepID=A0A917H1W7_9BACT|nr:sialate O-acetylesterase [Edaphobacter dinghuensis]GGG64871.1 9-O-acetylesterase [Edaphobacter dinghuensis]